MLRLLYELTSERLLAELQAVFETEFVSRRVCFVIPNPLLHAALNELGRNELPPEVEFITLADRVRLVDSSARVLVVDGEPKIPVFRSVVRCSEEHKLITSTARAVLTVLKHHSALHLVDAFDGPVVTMLRGTLRDRGVGHFIEEVLVCIERFNSGQSVDPGASLFSGLGPVSAAPPASLVEGVSEEWEDLGEQSYGFFAWLDKIRKCQDPHGYLKAMLSYFSYIKSNKNATKASKDLNISRTTLHDHLRLAEEFRITSLLESLQQRLSNRARLPPP